MGAMRIRVPEEFVPVARFPEECADWVAWVEESGRPVVVTRGGRAVAVLVGADDYFGGGDGVAVLRTLAEEMQRGEAVVTLPSRAPAARRPASKAKAKAKGKAKARGSARQGSGTPAASGAGRGRAGRRRAGR